MKKASNLDWQQWKGLAVADYPKLQAKIKRIQQDGPDNVYVCMDWDKTIVPDSVWDSVRSILPEEVRKRHLDLSKRHIPKLADGSLTEEEASAWQKDALDLLKGIRVTAIEKAVAAMPLREGAKEIFKRCEQKNIPTVIRSAVFRNAIDTIALKYGISPTVVIATDLLEERGKIAAWDPSTMTHDINKHIVSHQDLPSVLNERENTILIGDRMLDTLMVTGDNVLRIRVDGNLNPGDNQKWGAYLEESFDESHSQYYPYDAVAIEDNLLAVADLIHSLTA